MHNMRAGNINYSEFKYSGNDSTFLFPKMPFFGGKPLKKKEFGFKNCKVVVKDAD